MTKLQATLAPETGARGHATGRGRAHGALWRAAGVVALLAFLASCMVPPSQQGAYQQGPYPPGPYSQGSYQQGQVQGQYDAYGASQPAQPQGEMSVVYQAPTQKRQREQIRTFLQDTKMFEQVSAVLNRVFRFPRAVTIVWTECGAVNAAWDGEGTILMCYELAEYLKELFSKRVKNRKQLRIAVMSTLLFTFLHELGHGLISMYKIPAVGREEDAADQLAALILISTGKDGVEVTMRGAEFFRLLALSGAKTPFFDEHSLDAQRYYNVICLVYGSSPDQLGSLVGRDKLPASRARRCPSEYTKIYTAWASLLQGAARSGGQAPSQAGWQERRAAPSGYDSYDDGYDGDGYGADGYGADGYGDGYADEPAPRQSRPSRGSRGNSGSSGGSGGSGTWLCTAEGSIGTAYGDDSLEYSTETAHGTGPTRDHAASKAMEDCEALMSLASSLAVSAGKKRDVGSCSIVNCIGPGR